MAARSTQSDGNVPSRKVTPLLQNERMARMQVVHRINASDGRNFGGTHFPRDASFVMRDIMGRYPSVVRNELIAIAHYQGTRYNATTEESPGMMPHEIRNRYNLYEQVSPEELAVMHKLAPRFGWDEEGVSMCYYGADDTTLRWVIRAAEYARMWDPNFLAAVYRHRNGFDRTIEECVLECMRWAVRRVGESSLGLIAFKQINPLGHRNRSTRDSGIAYHDLNGDLAHAPIYSLDMQVLMMHACLSAVELMKPLGKYASLCRDWHDLALHIQNEIFRLFWNTKLGVNGFFEMALHGSHTNPVPLGILSNMASETLASPLFDGLDVEDRQYYVQKIIGTLCSELFLTRSGLRCLAVGSSQPFRPLSPYQGEDTDWPVFDGSFYHGLLVQGYTGIADQIRRRMQFAAGAAGASQEFYYVTPDGRPIFHLLDASDSGDYPVIYGTNKPDGRREGGQAWTISALMHTCDQPPVDYSLIRGFERKILGSMLHVGAISQSKLERAYRNSPIRKIDTKRAKELEDAIFQRHGYEH